MIFVIYLILLWLANKLFVKSKTKIGKFVYNFSEKAFKNLLFNGLILAYDSSYLVVTMIVMI